MSPLYAVVLSLLFLIATTNRSHFVHGSSRGCIELDDLTFDRVLQRYPDGALIKFDVAYPYGDKQQVYEQFAADVAASAGGLGALDLLVGCVGIKDYGEKDGATLAKRFAVTADYPDVQLFVGGATGRRVRFPSSEPFTAEALKQFVRHNSRINLGLAGCVPELDRLAAELVGQLQLGEADEVDGTLAKARDWVEAAVKAVCVTYCESLSVIAQTRLRSCTGPERSERVGRSDVHAPDADDGGQGPVICAAGNEACAATARGKGGGQQAS